MTTEQELKVECYDLQKALQATQKDLQQFAGTLAKAFDIDPSAGLQGLLDALLLIADKPAD